MAGEWIVGDQSQSCFFRTITTYTNRCSCLGTCRLLEHLHEGGYYSGDHAPLEYIALHSIVLQCTVYTQVSNGTIDDSRIFFEGLFLRILLEKIF